VYPTTAIRVTTEEISPAARELINRHLRSMDHAEAALFLADEPDRAHRPESVADRHRWSGGLARRVLADLTETGLTTAEHGAYRLDQTAASSAAMAELAELYHKRPVALVRAIYAAPVRVKPLLRPTLEDDPGHAGI
jgi:hypothetical protein